MTPKPTLEERRERVAQHKCPHRWQATGRWCASLPGHRGPHQDPEHPIYYTVTVRG